MPAEEGFDQYAPSALNGVRSKLEVNRRIREEAVQQPWIRKSKYLEFPTSRFPSTPYPNAFEDRRSDGAQPQI